MKNITCIVLLWKGQVKVQVECDFVILFEKSFLIRKLIEIIAQFQQTGGKKLAKNIFLVHVYIIYLKIELLATLTSENLIPLKFRSH